MEKNELQQTNDGTHTLLSHRFNQTYHSRHGAVQESRHVFIDAGMMPLLPHSGLLRIFEFGFGTGLNALLTWQMAIAKHQVIHYHTVEAYPVEPELYRLLHFGTATNDAEGRQQLLRLHQCAWNVDVALDASFTLHKTNAEWQELVLSGPYHLMYFDAFAPNAQPELWTSEVFDKLYQAAAPGAVLTTYCSKGDVRRAMATSGWQVHKLPGPPGKREMVRAIKPSAIDAA